MDRRSARVEVSATDQYVASMLDVKPLNGRVRVGSAVSICWLSTNLPLLIHKRNFRLRDPLSPLAAIPRETIGSNDLLSHHCDEGASGHLSAGSQPIDGHEQVRVPANRGGRRHVVGFPRVLPADAEMADSVSLTVFVAEGRDAEQAGCLAVAVGAVRGIRHCTVDQANARHSAGTGSEAPSPDPQAFAIGTKTPGC